MTVKFVSGGCPAFPVEDYFVFDNLADTVEDTDDPTAAWNRILAAIRDPLGDLDMEIWFKEEDGTDCLLVSARIDGSHPYRLVSTCLDNGLMGGFEVYSYATVEEAGENWPGCGDEMVLASLFRAEARGQEVPKDLWDDVMEHADFDEWDTAEDADEAVQWGTWRGLPIEITYRLPEDFDDRMNEAEMKGEGDAYLRTLVSRVRLGDME